MKFIFLIIPYQFELRKKNSVRFDNHALTDVVSPLRFFFGEQELLCGVENRKFSTNHASIDLYVQVQKGMGSAVVRMKNSDIVSRTLW